MRGTVSPVNTVSASSCLEILIEQDFYSIGRWQFNKPKDILLEKLTNEILECFDGLRITINKSKSLKLDADLCDDYLIKLAEWGRTAYQAFFGEDRANKILKSRLNETVAPTFVSESMPFPWEVLFEGSESDYERGNPEMFWGLRYTPARILNPEKDISEYVLEQSQPSDMLFCLHHRLLQAHRQEKPEIERLVKQHTSQPKYFATQSQSLPGGRSLLFCLYGLVRDCGGVGILANSRIFPKSRVLVLNLSHNKVAYHALTHERTASASLSQPHSKPAKLPQW
ncbi:hypothetical protein [Brunnivagina elsteri]|uniref:Uncharacterized protein n=1 Tax=Brunnivagina elsteri CCALA 953 TaxID=987040 RepID=A0A2A2TGG9_9CYAN|nr:hypothetical protein [Calothrix elsteri]PAX52822.1 hypothetical protein CK510_17255 [Calothrix elsteri CCALA 953]